MKKFLFLLAGTTALLFSCKKDNDKAGYYSGSQVAVHEGKSWSSVKLNEDGAPEQLILTIDNNALNSVPVGGGDGGHQHNNNLVVPLPAKALESTPFKFIFLNWNPSGHEPDGIYTSPHFDMHFYMSSEAEVMNAVDMAKINTDPAADYLPAMYVGAAPVPQMGKHWIDVTSPELNGASFTQTFIYGSYDGKVTFYEPMITLDFLKNTNHFERPIPQPARFQKSGYYPTKMQVVKHGNATNIILDGFVYRHAS